MIFESGKIRVFFDLASLAGFITILPTLASSQDGTNNDFKVDSQVHRNVVTGFVSNESVFS